MKRSPQQIKSKIIYAMLLIEGIIKRFKNRKSLPLNPCGKIKILIVRLDLIGDFFLWLPFARTLRQLYPSCRYDICLIGNSTWISVAEKLLAFDEFIPFDAAQITHNYKCLRSILIKISSMRIDIFLNPRFTRLVMEDLMNLFSRPQISFAFKHTEPDSNKIITYLTSKYYTNLIFDRPDITHISHKNNDFLKLINPTFNSIDYPILNQYFKSNLSISKYFLIFPFASSPEKNWGQDHFLNLINKIEGITGLIPIVCGTSNDKEHCQKIIENANGQCVNLAGNTSLDDIIGLICNADLVIGNDSSAIHIAALAGTPSLCIMSGAHYKPFVPYPEDTPDWITKPICVYHEMPCFQCDWVCTQRVTPSENPVPCLAAIRFEDAEKVVDDWLKLKYRSSSTE